MNMDIDAGNDLSKEELHEIYDKEHERIKEEAKKNAADLEKVEGLIDYDISCIHSQLEDIGWGSEGFVNIGKTKGEKGKQIFWIEEEGLDSPIFYKVEEEEDFYYLIYQERGGVSGDNFGGQMLFPLSDGTYWRVSYSC